MAYLKGFLQLIRVVNLAFILLTQVLFFYFIILPVLAHSGLHPALDTFHFALLVLSTLLIAAAGYIINDYFDVKIDQINKPDQITIDRGVERNAAILMHSLLNFSGIILGFYIAVQVGRWYLGFLHLFTSLLLWLYSVSLKRQFLTGNIVVSMLTALVIFLVVFYAIPSTDLLVSDFSIATISKFTIIFGGFAFLVSLIREIIKDMQDVKGDMDYHCNTIPVVLGIPAAKRVVLFLSVLLIIAVSLFQFYLFIGHRFIIPVYGLLAIQLPVVYLLARLNGADKSRDFGRLSNIVKMVMLAGILSMALIYWTDSPALFF